MVNYSWCFTLLFFNLSVWFNVNNTRVYFRHRINKVKQGTLISCETSESFFIAGSKGYNLRGVIIFGVEGDKVEKGSL